MFGRTVFTRLGKRLGSLVGFIVVSALAGVLVAGLAIPAVSLVSSSGKDAITSLEGLPTELETPPQSERSRLLNADGSLLTYFYDENRVYKPLAEIAPVMLQAQVAIEDHRFFEHGAFDVQGTLRAAVSTSQGVPQGGSAITQQYVRLVLVADAQARNDPAARVRATENTVDRKIRELRYALALEQKFTKEEILERYLNISYYGDGAYGVEAAARHYFGISAAQLGLAQAAMLAGLVRNPVLTNPVKNPTIAIERRNDVLDRMASPEVGAISPEQAAAAKAEPFDPSKVRANKLGCANSRFPFICDYALHTLLRTESLGDTVEEREARIKRGGLTITTTVDPALQKKSEKIIAGYLAPRDPAVAVITMVEPGTGRILTMAQSRPVMGDNITEQGAYKWKGETYYNYAVSHDMGGAEGFQGGSTFKLFVAAAALDDGMGAYGTYDAKSSLTLKGPFTSCDGDFMLPDKGGWDVAGGGGVVNMFQGVKRSVNTYFAQLIQAVGVCKSVKMATRLGLQMSKPTKDHPDIMSYDVIPSFTLGAVEVTPLSLVNAYATMGARGIYCTPVILRSIKTAKGAALAVPDANCHRVVSKEVADGINEIFQGAFNGGTATPARIPGLQLAGKTGTVPRNKALWTIGYTPDLAAAAALSWDSGTTNPSVAKYWAPRKGPRGSYLRGARMPYSDTYIVGSAGGPEAGPHLLKPAITAAVKNLGLPKKRFVEPPSSILRGERVNVPRCSGVAACRAALRKAGFLSYESKVDSDEPKGAFVGLNPSGSAPKKSAIAIQVSNGPKKGSQAWCEERNNADSRCVKYLPPPVGVPVTGIDPQR